MNARMKGVITLRTQDDKDYTCANFEEFNETVRKIMLEDKTGIVGVAIQGSVKEEKYMSRIIMKPDLIEFLVSTPDEIVEAEPPTPTTDSSTSFTDDVKETVTEDPTADFNNTLFINEKWSNIFGMIKEQNPVTALWLAGVNNVQVENGQIILYVCSYTHLKHLQKEEHTKIIEGAILVLADLNMDIKAKFTGEDM